MSKEKQIESTDWLIRGIPKEQLEREKRVAIMSADLEMCHTEFSTGVGEIYTDYDTTAQKMFAIGYRKQSEWISVEERLPVPYADVIVYDKASGVIMDSMLSTGEFVNGLVVTHWMTLPEAPKKGGEE